MDSTPIYTELRKTLIDPEADHWGTSAPPEFATALESSGDHANRSEPASGTHRGARGKEGTGRKGGRRHRAED